MVAILDNVIGVFKDPFTKDGQSSTTGILILILLIVVPIIMGIVGFSMAKRTMDPINPTVNPSGSPALLPALTAATVDAYAGGLAGFSGARHLSPVPMPATGLISAPTSSVTPTRLAGLAAAQAGL